MPGQSPLDDSTWRPKAIEGIEIHEVDDGCILFQGDRDRVHHLNRTAVILLALCTGENTATGMAEMLRSAFGLVAPPERETRACLEQLLTENLIT